MYFNNNIKKKKRNAKQNTNNKILFQYQNTSLNYFPIEIDFLKNHKRSMMAVVVYSDQMTLNL